VIDHATYGNRCVFSVASVSFFRPSILAPRMSACAGFRLVVEGIDDSFRIDERIRNFCCGGQKQRAGKEDQEVPNVSLKLSERKRLFLAKDISHPSQGMDELDRKITIDLSAQPADSTSTTWSADRTSNSDVLEDHGLGQNRRGFAADRPEARTLGLQLDRLSGSGHPP